MTQPSNQSSLSTDAYPATQSIVSTKTGTNANQKKMLGIAAATVLLGGAIGLALAHTPRKPEGPRTGFDGPQVPEDENQTPITLPSDVDVAGKVTDDMSFEQAFGAAREEVGVGGAFNWHGRWYNTFEKDEWTGLSLEQRQEYTEMITGEKLPVKPYHSPQSTGTPPTAALGETQTEPTIIEGYLNGQRVMGLDLDQDGIIDTVVMDGPDGQTYRVVDTSGNEGLDTVYRYDSLDGQLTGAIVLDKPFVLSNDDFSQGLEATMSKEVVDSILNEPSPSTLTPPEPTGGEPVNEPEPDDAIYLADSSEPDDTYVNNGNVRDMDE